MKSIKKDEKSVDKPFPKLMIRENGGVVTLFTSPNEGTVVNSGDEDSSYRLGEYREHWNTIYYTDYNGTIELSNS